MAIKVQYGEVQDHNYTASAPISGGQLVAFSGNRTVRPATAGDVVAGWCPYDVATGALAPVYRSRRVPVIVAGVVTAGQQAIPAAGGQADALAGAAATPTQADVNNGRIICGHFETGGAAGSEQALVIY